MGLYGGTCSPSPGPQAGLGIEVIDGGLLACSPKSLKFWLYRGFIGVYRDYIGIMEKKMETTILHILPVQALFNPERRARWSMKLCNPVAASF